MPDNNIHLSTLNNQLRIALMPRRLPVVYVGLMVGCGTRDEQQPLNGLAHYIEHCVFKGTSLYSASQIIRQTELIGGEVNAYTTKEETVFYAATLPSMLPRTIRLLSQLVLNPTFPDDETRKERQVIFDEIETYNDSPSDLIYDDFEALLFRDHPLSLPILGNKQSLRRITQKKAREFVDLNYTADNMVLFALGNIRFSTLRQLAEQYLGSATRSRQATSRQLPPDPQPLTCNMSKRTHQAHVMLGGKSLPLSHPEQYTMQLLTNIVGGASMNSMLNLSLREKHGLVYNIEMTHNPMSDCGYWSIYYSTDQHNIGSCSELINQTLSSLTRQPLNLSTLQHHKRQLYAQLAIAALNYENNALNMAKQVLYQLPLTNYQQAYRQINNITPQQLLELARMLFSQPIAQLTYT